MNGNEEDRRKNQIDCDICLINPGHIIKGGIYNNIRKMWFVCKECVHKIDNQRKII